MRALTGRVRFRKATRDHAIASLDSLMRRVEERSRAGGQSPDEAAAVVVEDLERAAAALNARTAPLVPGCGVLVRSRALLPPTAAADPGVEPTFGPEGGLLRGRKLLRGTVRGLTVLVQSRIRLPG
jgi:hypothetical protein